MQSLSMYPSMRLFNVVNHISIIEDKVNSNTVLTIPYYADGMPGIIYQRSEGGMFLDHPKRKLPELYLYGQTVRPISMQPKGSFRMIMFFLYPSAVRSIFGIRSSEIRDSCVDIDLFPNSELHDVRSRIAEDLTALQQVEIISWFLERQVERHAIQSDSIVHSALQHILHSSGKASIRDLRKSLHITERTFERRFEQYVGVGPKLYSRICQFQSSVKQLQQSNYSKLSDLAFNNGYADQSHFIRTFKEFTGLSPLEYLRYIKPNITESLHFQD
jgi:AraC-like DNA-binding protein